MPQLRVKLTRSELYHKVWSIPVYLAARDFRISINSLKNICAKHEVPIPYKGYWSSLKAGRNPEKKRLPDPTTWQPHLIEIVGTDFTRLRLQKLARLPNVSVPPVTIATKGPVVHSLTARTQRLLNKPRTDDAGILVSERAFLDHFRVSRQTLSRGLRILDALFVAFESEPFKLSWPEGSNTKVTVSVLGEPLRFSLAEIVRYTPHQPTRGEIFRQKHDWFWRPPRWDFHLTGRLQLIIDGIKGVRLRHVWSDGKRRLEACLGEFLISLVAVAKELKTERAEQGNWRQRWDSLRARELEAAGRLELSRRKIASLNQCFLDWQHARTVREFLKALEEEIKQKGTAGEQERHLLDRARKYLDSVDPVGNALQVLRRLDDDSEASQCYR